MVRQRHERNFEPIYVVVNDSAQAHRDVILADRWKEPCMSRAELWREVEDGVVFWGYAGKANSWA